MIDYESKCSNGKGDFCHNQGVCENFGNGTTKCHCIQNAFGEFTAYGERCQFLSDANKKWQTPPTFPNLDGKDGKLSKNILKNREIVI